MTTVSDPVARARTLLYAPGHRPDRFTKALESGADVIVLDLEDAVGPDLKCAARDNVHRWLSVGGPGMVRINGVDSPWHEDDMAMLDGRPCAVILPKAADGEQVAGVLNRLADGSCVVPLLETATGVLGARNVCAAPSVVRIIFGSADLASELGIDHTDRRALAYARSQVVLASAACGLAPPVDGVTSSVTDERTLIADAEDAAALGFTGKSCLHPRQVPVVQAVFTPSAEDLRWARDVLAAAGNGSAIAMNGEVVGKPVVDRARSLLSRSDLWPRSFAEHGSEVRK